MSRGEHMSKLSKTAKYKELRQAMLTSDLLAIAPMLTNASHVCIVLTLNSLSVHELKELQESTKYISMLCKKELQDKTRHNHERTT